jgi:hypothetical protein
MELPGILLGHIDKECEKREFNLWRDNEFKNNKLKKGGQNEKGKMGSI